MPAPFPPKIEYDVSSGVNTTLINNEKKTRLYYKYLKDIR